MSLFSHLLLGTTSFTRKKHFVRQAQTENKVLDSIITSPSPEKLVLSGSEYELVENESFGRHWVAARDLPAGTILFKEDALISGPYLSVSDYRNGLVVCFGCSKKMKKDLAKSCSRCNYSVCGVECEKLDCHKNYECSLLSTDSLWLSNHMSVTTYQSILILRAFLLKSEQPAKWNTQLTKLLSQQEGVTMSQPQIDVANTLYTMAMRLFRPKDRIASIQEWIKIVNIVKINSFFVADKDGKYSAQSLFFKGSFFAHSCRPNCEFTTSPVGSSQFQIFTATNVKKGSPLTVTYFRPSFQSFATFERRKFTANRVNFICKCERCVDPMECGSHMSTLRCGHCGRSATLLPTICKLERDKVVWNCTTPGCTVTFTTIDVQKMTTGLMQDFQSKTEIVEKFKIVEKAGKSLFHPQFCLLMRMRILLLKELIATYDNVGHPDSDTEQLHQVILEQLISVYDVINPGISAIRADLLNWYSQTVLETKLRNIVYQNSYLAPKNKSAILQLLNKMGTCGSVVEKYYTLSSMTKEEEDLVKGVVDMIVGSARRVSLYRNRFELVWGRLYSRG